MTVLLAAPPFRRLIGDRRQDRCRPGVGSLGQTPATANARSRLNARQPSGTTAPSRLRAKEITPLPEAGAFCLTTPPR